MHYHASSFVVSLAVVLGWNGGLLKGQEEPSELAQARSVYEKDIEFATRPIRDRYLSRLEALKRTLGSKGNVRAALGVQEEIDRISGAGQNGVMGKFEGLWRIEYENGATRRYLIKATGVVQAEDEKGKPVPTLSGKISTKGADILLELTGENKLERLTLNGNLLTVEHFDPKTTYPAGSPAVRGKGSRVQVRH